MAGIHSGRQAYRTPKRRDSGRVINTLSEYEHCLYWYACMHESYGWTREQIDGEEFQYLIELLVTKAKSQVEPGEKTAYVDEVL